MYKTIFDLTVQLDVHNHRTQMHRCWEVRNCFLITFGLSFSSKYTAAADLGQRQRCIFYHISLHCIPYSISQLHICMHTTLPNACLPSRDHLRLICAKMITGGVAIHTTHRTNTRDHKRVFTRPVSRIVCKGVSRLPGLFIRFA